ncbi:hypothetical protein EDB89DRAFT_862363 [Lactarius sanguifluus]|nr:hypothetical protein EDB89DRAFT_862363 [Lactarius sanguifluus]
MLVSLRLSLTFTVGHSKRLLHPDKEHLAYLRTHDRTHEKSPKSIGRIVGQPESLCMMFQSWRREQAIEIHLTIPYSPSQNGVEERMTHILVACAMIRRQNVLKSLWEPAS